MIQITTMIGMRKEQNWQHRNQNQSRKRRKNQILVIFNNKITVSFFNLLFSVFIISLIIDTVKKPRKERVKKADGTTPEKKVRTPKVPKTLNPATNTTINQLKMLEAQQRKFEGKIPILNSSQQSTSSKPVAGESILNGVVPEQKTPESQKIIKRKEQDWWHIPSTIVKKEQSPTIVTPIVPVAASSLSMGKINNGYFDNCASLTSLVTETNNYKKPTPVPTKVVLKPSGSSDYLNAFSKFLAQSNVTAGGVEIKDEKKKQRSQARKPKPNVDTMIKDEVSRIYATATPTFDNRYQENVNNYVARQSLNPEAESYAQLSIIPPPTQTPINYAMNNDDNMAMDYSYQNSRNYSRNNGNQQQYSTTPAPLTSPSYTSSYTPTQQMQFRNNFENPSALQSALQSAANQQLQLQQQQQQQAQQQLLQQQRSMLQFTQQMSQFQQNSSPAQQAQAAVAAMAMLSQHQASQQQNNQQQIPFNQQNYNNLLNSGIYSNSNSRVLSINEDK